MTGNCRWSTTPASSAGQTFDRDLEPCGIHPRLKAGDGPGWIIWGCDNSLDQLVRSTVMGSPFGGPKLSFFSWQDLAESWANIKVPVQKINRTSFSCAKLRLFVVASGARPWKSASSNLAPSSSPATRHDRDTRLWQYRLGAIHLPNTPSGELLLIELRSIFSVCV